MSDEAMERLLAYHGRRYWLTNGWSLRFRVWRVERTQERPHGLRYSFTLHDVDGERLLGYDNKHSASRKVVEHDHSHKFRRIRVLEPYAFVDADTLLADFFEAVRRACQMEGVGLEIEDEDVFEADDDKEDDDAPDAD
ncbi:MAG: DUF6516 family protein [Bacillota bacterium]